MASNKCIKMFFQATMVFAIQNSRNYWMFLSGRNCANANADLEFYTSFALLLHAVLNNKCLYIQRFHKNICVVRC